MFAIKASTLQLLDGVLLEQARQLLEDTMVSANLLEPQPVHGAELLVQKLADMVREDRIVDIKYFVAHGFESITVSDDKSVADMNGQIEVALARLDEAQRRLNEVQRNQARAINRLEQQEADIRKAETAFQLAKNNFRIVGSFYVTESDLLYFGWDSIDYFKAVPPASCNDGRLRIASEDFSYESFRAFAKKGEGKDVAEKNKGKDDTELRGSTRRSFVGDPHDLYVDLRSVGKEIQEVERAEQILHASQRRYTTLQDRLSDTQRENATKQEDAKAEVSRLSERLKVHKERLKVHNDACAAFRRYLKEVKELMAKFVFCFNESQASRVFEIDRMVRSGRLLLGPPNVLEFNIKLACHVNAEVHAAGESSTVQLLSTLLQQGRETLEVVRAVAVGTLTS